MSTTADIPCVAELQTETLADAIGKVCGNTKGRARRARSRRTPLVSFREATLGAPAIPQTYHAGIAYALVLPKRLPPPR